MMGGNATIVFGFPLTANDPLRDESLGHDETGCSVKSCGVFDSDELYAAAIWREMDMYSGSAELDLRALVDQESEATERLRSFCASKGVAWREPKWYQLFSISN